MKNLLWLLDGLVFAVLLFGSGVLIGRQFPAHHFEQIPQTPYLVDASTGHVCEYLPENHDTAQSKSAGEDPFLAVLGGQKAALPRCN